MTGTDICQGYGKRFLGILLDLDNTLYDFGYAKEEACRQVVSAVGVGTAEDLVRAFLFSPFGVESPKAIQSYLKEQGITDPAIFMHAVQVYTKAKTEAIRAYPGVYETLLKIHAAGLKIGAITNASEAHASERLRYIETAGFFECLVTPDNTGMKKPDPAMFLYAASLLKIQPHQICVIGDNLVNDIRPAKEAGMCTIHAEYGNRLPPEYAEGIVADFTISSFSDILQILGL
ncbi:MAG TPA: HAD family hydrolase [Methanospirillum sp.]|uniref:HAD family hydrolase n=1 Tax=Methanospirillum sp. TaxID=45200 RepID=UPI002C18FC92|nr:HAD family hydrolase [Methanospirillum sp.]HOJ97288.1 HAD family hydrolase [Methanospirillum sp.]HOL40889.1 HAD family hydrolase [Methanospirillum sp.]HPP77362.1 HAD family hydrolase [Methanospirillum sp.]